MSRDIGLLAIHFTWLLFVLFIFAIILKLNDSKNLLQVSLHILQSYNKHQWRKFKANVCLSINALKDASSRHIIEWMRKSQTMKVTWIYNGLENIRSRFCGIIALSKCSKNALGSGACLHWYQLLAGIIRNLVFSYFSYKHLV